MAQVQPAEVSAILKQELAGFRSEAELEEVGTVLQVGDGIARIYGLQGVQSGELIEFNNGLRAIVTLRKTTWALYCSDLPWGSKKVIP